MIACPSPSSREGVDEQIRRSQPPRNIVARAEEKQPIGNPDRACQPRDPRLQRARSDHHEGGARNQRHGTHEPLVALVIDESADSEHDGHGRPDPELRADPARIGPLRVDRARIDPHRGRPGSARRRHAAAPPRPPRSRPRSPPPAGSVGTPHRLGTKSTRRWTTTGAIGGRDSARAAPWPSCAAIRSGARRRSARPSRHRPTTPRPPRHRNGHNGCPRGLDRSAHRRVGAEDDGVRSGSGGGRRGRRVGSGRRATGRRRRCGRS